MPKFLIEREIPGAHDLTPEQLKGIAAKSNAVLAAMSGVQWVQSYITDDRITCVYIAPDEAAVRAHAFNGGFPADRVSEIRAIIDPTTEDGALYGAPRSAPATA
jgi:hypothetical protein